MIIAIDGPAASGKGTLGKRLAAHFGLRHLDTGLLYRAVAHALVAQGAKLDDPATAEAAARGLDVASLDEAKLKARGMAEPASIVSAIPQVRAALVDLQRSFAVAPPGAVLDGRDIGTVILPDADVKIYVDASPQVRARRRTAELRAKGEMVDEARILEDICRRDERDRNRSVAPLVPATDAQVLDTSELDVEAAFAAAVAIVEAARR
jgi:cytidylate kinase